MTQTDTIKAHGIHYTSPELARFLARVTVDHIAERRGSLRVLDPACGDGALLAAFAQALPDAIRRHAILVGYETDTAALERAERNLRRVGVGQLILEKCDFLSVAAPLPPHRQLALLEPESETNERRFEAIIANPPYVRTQVLGSHRAQELARRFRLTGRVDLYYAFVRGMAGCLKPGGILGLLTSNRFLTVKSGATLRQLLATEFDLRAIYDLGDTKLFTAAVLPAIIVARKGPSASPKRSTFDRVYEHRAAKASWHRHRIRQFASVLDALRDRRSGELVRTPTGEFQIERGLLLANGAYDAWSLSTPEYEGWLATVRTNQSYTFDDLAHIRVGIKTTADEVFIRADWQHLPKGDQPEKKLLRPLITHKDAARWLGPTRTLKLVLYPHVVESGKRAAIDLRGFPNAARYLERHRDPLTQRRYVLDGGRKWYEIWVPHNPTEWKKSKLVFPDISEQPRFFLDSSGAIVNGDCYWITLRRGVDDDWLLLMLAVANSTFVTRYYDIAFHNKLYAGRRRFMTQYAKQFPLPDLSSPLGRQIVDLVGVVLSLRVVEPRIEADLDNLVWRSFGLIKEV